MPIVYKAAIFANVFLQFSITGRFRIPSSKTVPVLPYINRQPFIETAFVNLHHFRKQFFQPRQKTAPLHNPSSKYLHGFVGQAISAPSVNFFDTAFAEGIIKNSVAVGSQLI